MAFQAIFEKACVDFDSGKSPTLSVTWNNEVPAPLAFETPSAGESQSAGGNISSLGGYFNELQTFIECILSGTPPADATLQDARRALAVTLAEIESTRALSAVSMGAAI
jgi:predicted dehydrogenase